MIDPDEDLALRELDQGRGPCTGIDAVPRIRGLVETAPVERWIWRDRRWVLDVVRRTNATHYVYAAELDPMLHRRWRRPFGAAELGRHASLVEERVAVMGVAITPIGIRVDEPAEHDALAAKVDQLLDVGYELVLVRFDLPDIDLAVEDQVRIVCGLWERVAGRADVVVAPAQMTQTWAVPELDVLSSGLPEEVLIAWCGTDPLPSGITLEELRRRSEATGGRAPLVWDDHGVHDHLQRDRLAIGPYLGRDPEALAASGGWLRTTPAIARTTVPHLISYSGWLAGEDPVEVWDAEAGDLRHFVEGCEGRVPREHAAEVLAALDTPDWMEPMARAAEWLQRARTAETPHMGSGVRRWRKHLHQEAGLAVMLLAGLQLLRPVAVLGDDGHGVVHPPATEVAATFTPLVVGLWAEMVRKSTTVMGERASIDARLAPGPSGSLRFHGPILREGRNVPDQYFRAYTAQLQALPPGDPDLVVSCGGTALDVGEDGSFRAPPGEPVLLTWDRWSTRVVPGSPPSVVADPRLGSPAAGDR